MRYKLLLIVFGLSLSTLLHSQEIVYFQDFQSGTIPNEITLINLDGQIPTPAPMENSSNAWINGYHPGDPANRFAMSSSTFSSSVEANRWLILPKLQLPGSGALKWKVRSSHLNQANWVKYQVLISETGMNTDTDFFQLMEETAPNMDSGNPWSARTIDLSSYAGKEVYIAFRCVGRNGWLIFLDDIEVSGLFDLDMEMTQVVPNKYHYLGSHAIEGRVSNKGVQEVNSFNIICKSTDGQYITSKNYSGLALQSGQQIAFTLPDIQMNSAGIVDFKCYIENPNQLKDDFNANDTLYFTRVFMENSAPKKVLAEMYTGTWCGFCPRGTVTLNKILDTTDYIIPVFIHQGDVMTIPEADSLIMFMPNGYPTATFDRVNQGGYYKPGLSYVGSVWPDYIVKRKDNPSPVSIELNHEYTHEDRNLTLQATFKFVSETKGLFKVNCLLTENNLHKGLAYDQANFSDTDPAWPELNGKGNPMAGYKHNYVLRESLLGTWGNESGIPNSVAKDDSFTVNFNFTVSENYNSEEVYLAVYLSEQYGLDHELEILNIAQIKIHTRELSVTEKKKLSLIVYPNPVENQLNISGIEGAFDWDIMDLTGRILLSGKEMNDKIAVIEPLDKLAAGTYIIKVTQGNQSHVTKFLKY